MKLSEQNTNKENDNSIWPIIEFSAQKYKQYFDELGLPSNILIDYYDFECAREDDFLIESNVVYSVVVGVKKVKETIHTEYNDLPFFIKNTSNLDKGLVAFLNGLGNILDQFMLPEDSILGRFFKEVKNLSPEKRAEALENNSFFKAIHKEFANNDTKTSDYDFLAYRTVLNSDDIILLLEIDGSKDSPILRRTFEFKDCVGTLDDISREIQRKIDDGEILDDVIFLSFGEK